MCGFRQLLQLPWGPVSEMPWKRNRSVSPGSPRFGKTQRCNARSHVARIRSQGGCAWLGGERERGGRSEKLRPAQAAE